MSAIIEPRTTNHEPRTTNHEPPRFIQKISDGEVVDLSLLSKEQLLKLHYSEEKFTATELLKMNPFSHERAVLLNKGYDLVSTVIRWYRPNESSFGASDSSVGLVCKFLAKQERPLTLYEAGVGVGYSARVFMKYPNVSMKGCDVVLCDAVKELMQEFQDRISFEESTLYDSLKKLEDESIDMFYADNVFEHLFPDEFPAIMEVLARKLKHGALLFLFIPNRLTGPHDVTGKFLKMGQKAEGFHFMEMTYREVTEFAGKYGIVPAYLTFKTIFKNLRYIKDSSGKLNRLKLFIESVSRFVPPFMREKVIGLFGLTSYIMVRQ